MDTKARLEQVNKDIAALIKNKEELVAELAAAEKPKLRHGDEILCINGSDKGNLYYCLYIKDAMKENGQNPLVAVDAKGWSCGNVSWKKESCVATGRNIFDDLAQLQVDVEEFETRCIVWRMNENKDRDLMFGAPHGQGYYVDHADIPKLILNLRRMYATHQRKQNLE